jgi:hypothetical protein
MKTYIPPWTSGEAKQPNACREDFNLHGRLLKNIEHEISIFHASLHKMSSVVQPMVRYACSSTRSRPMIYV